MGLSRLDNFLKSARGTILYVNPNDLDATDSIENQGNSLTRPFKTIQRALIEAARFSYQRGLNNDRFGKTTILIYPGDHIVDNRPGWIPDGANNFRLRSGITSSDLSPFDLSSNFDLSVPENDLYKLNSIHGGVIIPRGTSLVGLDLRKTKIRPKYVPNPTNDNIERSCIFRVTGGCYFWQFSMFDSDPNGQCYVDYTNNLFVPNFSHHKLSCFEYADGTNGVDINDDFQTYRTNRTDLDMYYEKVGIAYGQSSGRPIEPDYPSSALDIQPKVDEYRIVGSTGQSVGISSIKAGDGVTATTTITVTTTTTVPGLDVDTPFRIEGITATGYNGQFVVTEKLNDTQITYQVQNAPVTALPAATGSTLSLSSDTVTSASPYIFNISLRSVYGMCGVLADGDKASGFKSMVIAQFTGIGLQKDDNAFVLFDQTSGTYQDSTVPGNETISNNSRAVFKPNYRNFHIKAVNDAFIQNVSIFAIGYAEHFVTENGGDMSITNSNSNFGARALVAAGFRRNAFSQDDLGYITHIIPPKEISITENAVEFNALDVGRTIGIASTAHLYLYNQTNSDVPPENVIDGYRIGARENDRLNVLVSFAGTVTEYNSRIVMPGSQSSSQKSFAVTDNTSSILTFAEPHTFLSGESIRVFGSTGQIPDGLLNNRIYYAITDDTDVGIGNTQIKIAKTLNDALSHTAVSPNNVTFNNSGEDLKVVSRVSDKNSGDIGHPIQFNDDSSVQQWYINVSTAATDNTIYPNLVGIGSTALGSATPRTFIKRKSDTRNAVDTIYRLRYVIPQNTGGSTARPPTEGFILQESGTSIGLTASEIQTYFGSGSLTNESQQRNFRFVAGANWSAGSATVTTELPHDLNLGSQVELVNITSTLNTSGVGNSGFNGTYDVTGISSSRTFTVGINTDPGTFTNNTSSRDTDLPYFKKKRYSDTFYIYREQEVQPYIQGEQDGVYYLTIVNASNSPTVAPFTDEKFSQPVKELYPQTNRDNPNSDPKPSVSFASPSLIGEVVVDDVRNSITKETIDKKSLDSSIGVGVTDIESVSSSEHVIYTSHDHGLNRITRVSIANSGLGYGSGVAGDLYNASLVGFAGSTTGSYATAKLTVNASGNVTDVIIMDGGSAYGIGNTMVITGVPTFGSPSDAVVEVTQIYNNVGDTVRIAGVGSDTFEPFNDLYRITEVSVGAAKSFTTESSKTISSGSITGIGADELSNSFVYVTGEAIRISSLTYDNLSGIATFVSNNKHGLRVDNTVRISGADQDIYNGDFSVKEIIGTGGTSFSMNLGIGTYAPTATGTIYAYRRGLTSNEGNITPDNENIDGRMDAVYAGITTTLITSITDVTTDSISISNVSTLDLRIGDYLQINNEIVRIKTTVTNPASNPIYVFRGVLGSQATTHPINSVVRRIDVEAVEFRRHSISRASGHTFEYVGFGPGNYSTAFPDKQDRQISNAEELLAQSTRREGGINFYTGMNDKGISYNGNKKLSTVTGQEEIFDTPIQTITGEDISNLQGINVINPIEGLFTRSIRVEGGSDGNATSEFNGPVIFNNKVTSTSTRGMEANSLFLQGDTTVSRKYTVGIATPGLAGNPSDIVYYANPTDGGYVGWIYTVNNDWRRFGSVSISADASIGIFDSVGIGTTSPGDCTLKVGSGTTLFCVDGNGVGIGTTANQFKLHVNGNTNIIGTCYASYFEGDGSGLTSLNASATGWTNISGGIYNTSLNSVGIGTSVPRYNLEVGSVGVATTSMYVNGEAKFVGIITTNDLFVSGIVTATGFNLQSASGEITAGIVTTTDLIVGTSGTTLTTSSSNIGVGTDAPRAKFDVEGLTRIKTLTTNNISASSVSSILTLDLSASQNFEVTLTENITQITLENIPADCSEFTIKFTQDASSSYTVDFDDIRNNGGSSLGILWAGGGILPIMTPTVSRSDIYSYKTFDSGNNWYGIVVGQNFV